MKFEEVDEDAVASSLGSSRGHTRWGLFALADVTVFSESYVFFSVFLAVGVVAERASSLKLVDFLPNTFSWPKLVLTVSRGLLDGIIAGLEKRRGAAVDSGDWAAVVCAAASGGLKYGCDSWDIGEMTASIMCKDATVLVLACWRGLVEVEKFDDVLVVAYIVIVTNRRGEVWRCWKKDVMGSRFSERWDSKALILLMLQKQQSMTQKTSIRY